VTPRCWAKGLTFGAYCAHDAGHEGIHESKTKRFLWDEEIASAYEHGATGRKSAALRILEVSHEADRLLIVNNIGPRDWPELLRAIAARLYASNAAANADIATLCGEIGQGARLDECFDPLSPKAVFNRQILALLNTARDILRPFAS
jgi:hypothetical protein